jgi:putative membrane protein
MMGWHGDHMGGGGWALMSLGMVVVAVALVLGAVALVRLVGGPTRPPATPVLHATPEQLLAERFARGEIDEADYTARRTVLREQSRT